MFLTIQRVRSMVSERNALNYAKIIIFPVFFKSAVTSEGPMATKFSYAVAAAPETDSENP